MMKGRMGPWTEFCSRSSMLMPKISEVPSRIKENRRFAGNYAVCTGIVLCLWVITHPMTLIVVAGLAITWTYLLRRKEPVVIAEKELSERQAYLGLTVITGLMLMMTGAAETMLYGLSVSLFLCLLHAVFHAESTDVEYTGLPTTSGDLELGSVDMSPLGDQAEEGNGLNFDDITSFAKKAAGDAALSVLKEQMNNKLNGESAAPVPPQSATM